MEYIEIGGTGYNQIDIHSKVLLTDEQLDSFIESYNKAVKTENYTGSLEDFCSFCLTVGANVYLLQLAKVISGDTVIKEGVLYGS